MPEIKPVSIEKILDPEEFSNGDIVKCISGKLTAIYQIKKGTGHGGDYEYQGAQMQIGGQNIDLTFSKCSQPTSAKGQTITITSTETAHGRQGIKIDDQSYEKEGKQIEKRVLKITPAADIVYEGGASAAGKSEQPQQGSRTQSSSAAHPKEIIKDAILLHGYINEKVRNFYKEGEKPAYDGETIRSYVATVFIESCKMGASIDFEARMKKAPVKSYPPPPKDPRNWKECVIPKGEFEGKTLADMPDDALLKLFSFFDEKASKTPMALCVYAAVEERNILPKGQANPGDLEPATDDEIPWT